MQLHWLLFQLLVSLTFLHNKSRIKMRLHKSKHVNLNLHHYSQYIFYTNRNYPFYSV